MSKKIKELGGSSAALSKIDPSIPQIPGYDFEPEEGSHLVEQDLKGRLKIDKGFMLNIASQGVIQPIICRFVGAMLIVVAGRRRVVHARAANEYRAEQGQEPIEVRLVLQAGGDNPEAMMTMVGENSFRQDLTHMSQAKTAAAMQNAGYSMDDIALAFGFSRSTAVNRLKLLELPKEVQKLVHTGALSSMTALELKDQEPEKAVEIARDLAQDNKGKKGQVNRAREKTSDAPIVQTPKKSLILKIVESEDFGLLSTEVRWALVYALGPKKVVQLECFKELDPLAQRTMRWLSGDLKTPNTIEGLGELVKSVSGKKSPPRPEELADAE